MVRQAVVMFEATKDLMNVDCSYISPEYEVAMSLWYRVRKSTTLVAIRVSKKENKDV